LRSRRHLEHDASHYRPSGRAPRSLFAKTLTVKTLAPLPDPDRVFAGIPTLDQWRSDDTAIYVLAVSDTTRAAPAVARALVSAGADVLSISESRHSLEDIYLELIDRDDEGKLG